MKHLLIDLHLWIYLARHVGLFVPYSQWVIAITGVATLFALGWYTWETMGLRVASQQQVAVSTKQYEASYRPIVVATFTPISYGDRTIQQFALQNVGTGPAIKVQFEPIRQPDVKVSSFESIFLLVQVLGASDPVPLTITQLSIPGGVVQQAVHGSLYDWIDSGALGDPIAIIVRYRDIVGNRFKSVHTLTVSPGFIHSCVLDSADEDLDEPSPFD